VGAIVPPVTSTGSGSRGRRPALATMGKRALSATDFRFHPMVSSKAASTRARIPRERGRSSGSGQMLVACGEQEREPVRSTGLPPRSRTRTPNSVAVVKDSATPPRRGPVATCSSRRATAHAPSDSHRFHENGAHQTLEIEHRQSADELARRHLHQRPMHLATKAHFLRGPLRSRVGARDLQHPHAAASGPLLTGCRPARRDGESRSARPPSTGVLRRNELRRGRRVIAEYRGRGIAGASPQRASSLVFAISRSARPRGWSITASGGPGDFGRVAGCRQSPWLRCAGPALRRLSSGLT